MTDAASAVCGWLDTADTLTTRAGPAGSGGLGVMWSRFLQGRCVEAMDVAADGSVWVLASKSDARFPLAHLYVTTPEAVAAAE